MWDTVSGILKMKTYPVKERCTTPCTIAQPSVFYRKKHKNNVLTVLMLDFADTVVYTTKALPYGPSQFLIDMGSSLGLWFGLSLFGITDKSILALQRVKNMGTKMRMYTN